MLFIKNLLKKMRRDKREKMMMEMMPAMMEGIDMNQFLPKMMMSLFKDLSAEEALQFFENLISNHEGLSKIGRQISNANLMPKVMMKKWVSQLPFEETVSTIRRNAPNHGWHIPDTRNLQKVWQEKGFENAERVEILYFCNPEGGYAITRADELKALTVMMPMGVSVYETSKGQVEIAAMNIGMMSHFFTGTTREVLSLRAVDLEQTVSVVVA